MTPQEELRLREELATSPAPVRELAIRELLATPEQLSSIESEKGFTERVGERLDERREQVADTFTDYSEGEIGKTQAAIQTVGKGVAGPALDILGEGMVSAARGIDEVTPESIKEPVKEWASEEWKGLVESPLGELASKALDGGMEMWQGFKRENPQAAKTIESVVNIGILFAPAKTKKNAGPTTLKTASGKVGKTAGKQIAQRRDKFVADLILPKQTQKVKLAEVPRTTEIGKGVFKRSVIEPTTREAAIAKEVYRIKDVKTAKSIQQNYNAINKTNVKLAKELEANVAKSKTPVPLSESYQAIDDAINTLVKENPTIVGNAQLTATRIADKAKQIIANNGETPSGLLKSRKELDNWIRAQKGSKAFDPALENTLSVSVKSIRNAMNDLLDTKVKNAAVKKELSRQNLLYDALENIGPKAAEEANTAIGRAWQNALRALPIKNKIIQEAALVSGIGGLGAAALFAPPIAITYVTYRAGKAGFKAVISPKTKIYIGKVIKATDEAILTSKNPSMIKQLRLDRALMVELLQNAEVEE